MEGSLEFQIKIGSRELRNFSLNHAYKSFSGVFGLLFSCAMLMAAVYFYGQVEPAYFTLLLLMGALFTVWNPLLLSYKAYKQAKNPAFSQPLSYRFSDEGIKIRQGGQEADFPWEEVRKVVSSKKAYYIYMSQLRAYILPKDQMGTDEGAFVNMAGRNLPGGKLKGIKGGIK